MSSRAGLQRALAPQCSSWREGSAVPGVGSSCKGPGLKSQQAQTAHNCLQLQVLQSPLGTAQALHTCDKHTHASSTHTCKTNKPKRTVLKRPLPETAVAKQNIIKNTRVDLAVVSGCSIYRSSPSCCLYSTIAQKQTHGPGSDRTLLVARSTAQLPRL